MKKLILSAFAALACATTTSATTPINGTTMAGVARGYLPGESALPVVSFNCSDPKFGNFDMCIDMVFVLQQPRPVETLMDVKINPAYAKSHPRVILRYAYHKMPARSSSDFAVVTVSDKAGQRMGLGQVWARGDIITAIRVSEDGGQSWSRFYRESR